MCVGGGGLGVNVARAMVSKCLCSTFMSVSTF